MRNRLMLIGVALLLASPGLASAQQKPATPAPAAVPASWTGSIDFGARGSSTDGDEARYERFRDLRSGAFSNISLRKETSQYRFDVKLQGVGYRDQRYTANYDQNGKVKVAFLWDSTPFNYSYNSSTPWVEQSAGVFTLDPATRLLIQNGTPGVLAVPQNATQLATASVYRGLARPFGIQARRDVVGLTASIAATKDLKFNALLNSTRKTGHEPKGAGTAFSYANQLPWPLDNRSNDFSAAAEWTKPEGMLRVAWDGSWFNNDIHEILFDNAVRATDTSPYDASGYSNGRGAATSRIAAPPSNSLNTVSAVGLYKMQPRTSVNGQLSLTSMRQNDDLIPWTSNQVISSSGVFASFPGLARLPRSTAEAKVRGMDAMLNFSSRPTRYFGLSMRYRFNDHRNLTPIFDAVEYVRMDAVPEETGGETEHYNIRQNTFDVNGLFTLRPTTSVRVGYTLDDFKRTGRAFSDSTDYTFRTTLDQLTGQYVTLRVIYEHTARIGTGFSEQVVEEGGFQPGLRTYDEADRTRNRGWLVLNVIPASIVDFTFSLAAGKDRYHGPGHEFGLLDNSNAVYNFGVNVIPTNKVHFGANYGRDSYKTNQSARNASPPGTDYGTWFDPNRTWFLNNDEKVNNLNVYLDVLNIVEKADIRIGYDYSDSDNSYIHSGPRIQELSTNRALSGAEAIVDPFNPVTGQPFTIPSPCGVGLSWCFEALPKITNNWHRLTADFTYKFAPRVGLRLGYWYEKFDITDYATIDLPGQAGTPRIDYLGLLYTGYGNRPYTGSTGFVRILYSF